MKMDNDYGYEIQRVNQRIDDLWRNIRTAKNTNEEQHKSLWDAIWKLQKENQQLRDDLKHISKKFYESV